MVRLSRYAATQARAPNTTHTSVVVMSVLMDFSVREPPPTSVLMPRPPGRTGFPPAAAGSTPAIVRVRAGTHPRDIVRNAPRWGERRRKIRIRRIGESRALRRPRGLPALHGD